MKKFQIAFLTAFTALSLAAHAEEVPEPVNSDNLEKIAEFTSHEVLKNVDKKKYKWLNKAISKYNPKKHGKLKEKVLRSELSDEQKALALTVMDEIEHEKMMQLRN